MFEVGDIVRNKHTGQEVTVTGVLGTPEYDSCGFGSAEEGFTFHGDITGYSWDYQRDYVLVTPKTWKAGDIVIANEEGLDIVKGKKYVLTHDEEVSCIIKFDDDVGWGREQTKSNYIFYERPGTPCYKPKEGDRVSFTTATEASIANYKPLSYDELVAAAKILKEPATNNWYSSSNFGWYAYQDPFESDKQPSIKTALRRAKEGIMEALREVPKRLKRTLNKSLEAMYQLGWIDSDLDYTESGTDELIDMLHDEYEEKLGERAIKAIAKFKKEQEKCKKC